MTDHSVGFLHPLIHLGFGVEFKQPAIIAEALAQAAVHDAWIAPYLFKAEKAASGKPSSKSMVSLLDEIRTDEKLSTAAHWDDGNKIRDGILKRAPDEMIKYASQWTVDPDQLEEKTAEMTNAASMSNTLPRKLLICSLTAAKFTSPAVRNTRQSKSNSTFTTCTASTAPSSSLLSSSNPGSANRTRLASSNGRVGSTCACTHHAARRSHSWMKSQTTDPRNQRKTAMIRGLEYSREPKRMTKMDIWLNWSEHWRMGNRSLSRMKIARNSGSKAKCGCSWGIWVSTVSRHAAGKIADLV